VQKCEGLEEPRKRQKENQQQEKENEVPAKVKYEKRLEGPMKKHVKE
jgi:hypothetical protein